MIASIDAQTVACYVTQVEMYKAASAQLAREGMTVTSPNGMLRTNPVLRAQQDALSALQRTGKQLGITPASRNRVKPNGKTRERESNPFKSFT